MTGARMVAVDDAVHLVLTPTLARRDGRYRTSWHAQVLDARQSPAVLHSPPIVHDGAYANAVRAARRWWERQGVSV